MRQKFNNLLSLIGLFLILGIVTYAFLSLTNWSFSLKEWTGFSRFLLGVEGVVFIFYGIDEISK